MDDRITRILGASLDQAGPARPLSERRATEMVRAICADHDARPAPPPRPARWLGRVVAAVVLGAALSASAMVAWQRLRPTARPPGPVAPVFTPPGAGDSSPRARPAAAPPAGAVAPRASKAAPPRPAPAARPRPFAAADPLARANRLRADRRWREAADAYASVIEDGDPHSAYVATLARATLLLDRLDRPAQAGVLFRRALALAPAGALNDEALYGLAASSRALGDVPGERAALERLIADIPGSPLRRRAQARVEELGGRGR